ncbi:sepiapterin reductase [Spea bombifrons]|uniref:sepiapterin reductase n=1 Tax=Spea bombifrons TaxID=233779 RepID=UPI00234AA406|nr:sepiapterin reductase [Spea bombifrons]
MEEHSTRNTAGAQDTAGTQETSGTQGTAGTQSTAGTQDTAGTQETSGTQGTASAQGTAGTQDTAGTQETSGTRGSLGRVVCILTGASRGFGYSLALELCSRVSPGSEILLVSRTEDAMRCLAEELGRKCPGVRALWQAADLGTQEGVAKVKEAAQELQGCHAAEKLIIVNNAGSLGDIRKSFVDFTDPEEVNKYFSFNVTSAMCLTASLLRAVPSRPGLQRAVVNVSSLAALKPQKSWTLYCSGKAARDMMFQVLATEEPDIRVLNYAPGPLDNEMQRQVRTETADPDIRRLFGEMKEKGQLVECGVSARKMIDLLVADSYQSGAHVDFFD